MYREHRGLVLGNIGDCIDMVLNDQEHEVTLHVYHFRVRGGHEGTIAMVHGVFDGALDLIQFLK
jgi:hypothetical protein